MLDLKGQPIFSSFPVLICLCKCFDIYIYTHTVLALDLSSPPRISYVTCRTHLSFSFLVGKIDLVEL